MKKNRTKNTIIGLTAICAAIIVIYFAVVNIPKTEEKIVMTDAAKELTQNFETNYPSTPREVLKHYGEISKCFYQEDTTEEQIGKLAKMMWQLFDEELKQNQTYDDYIAGLRAEILQYRDKGKSISSYGVSSSTDVKYSDNEYGRMATLFLTFNMRENGRINRIKEEFILRRDAEGHWKILGWQLSDG